MRPWGEMLKGGCQFWTGTFRQEKRCWIMTLDPNTVVSCREIQSGSYKRRQYSLTSHAIGFYISLFVSNFAIKFLKLFFLAKMYLSLSLCLSAVRSNLRGIWQAQGPSFPQKLERKKLPDKVNPQKRPPSNHPAGVCLRTDNSGREMFTVLHKPIVFTDRQVCSCFQLATS